MNPHEIRTRRTRPMNTNSHEPLQLTKSPPKPLWRTMEFVVYYGLILLALVLMLQTTFAISNEEHSNFTTYRRRLTNGYLFGRKVDNSDSQWRGFRDKLPLLTLGVAAHLLLSHTIKRLCRNASQRTFGSFVLSLAFLYGLHGHHTIKLLSFMLINYFIAKIFKGSVVNPIATWIFNIAVLFLNEWYHGYQFSTIHLGWIDKTFPGLLGGWWIYWKMSALRCISFNMDYYWSHHYAYESLHNQPLQHTNEHQPTEKERITSPHPSTTYTLLPYLSYITYAPLLLAGPIITFNNFMSQINKPDPFKRKETIWYCLRLALVLFMMEVFSHCFYVVAISKERERGSLKGLTPFQISMVGFWNLKFIWLKLLIIWRYFRAWAMLDNISTVENMHRCMCNNYSALGFWRGWHRSYNRWLVRYVYIPLGGNKTATWNIFIVFTFVAIWHDISLSLLAWGWLISLFILPEIAAKKVFGSKRWKQWRWYRHLSAFGGVLNVYMMMIANLIGYAVGLEGMNEMLKGILQPSGIGFILANFVVLFAAVNIMFEVRNEEARAMARNMEDGDEKERND